MGVIICELLPSLSPKIDAETHLVDGVTDRSVVRKRWKK